MFTNKGEMGIGTLIIFIALLLVAAVAAGVLIQTSGSLQEKALTTGDQAKSQIATNAKVVEVSATDGRQGGLRYFTQIVKLAPGSESIKLDQTIITFNTFDKTATLQYVNGTAENNCSTGYCTVNGTGNYTVEYLQTGSNHVPGNLQRGDVIKIYYEAPKNVTESEEVRINLIPKIGTSTLTKFVTPEVISTERVYLYP
ncbi:MAG: archaellin/type IV pilin N-terminal domain-containing protein [Candidatus Woesearchaeota archaeon]